jgi:hypothetical protein
VKLDLWLRGGFETFAGWGLADLRRRARHAPAAILGEIAEQRVHRREMRRVDHRAAFAPNAYEARHPQPIEMKGERIGRNAKRHRNLPGLHPLRPRLHQQAERIETTFLRKGGKRRNGIIYFHISTNIEIYNLRQVTTCISELLGF